MLERVKVVLDIQRMEGVAETMRFVFAAAAGAVMVTEPADRRDLLVPGRHIVEAPADEMTGAIVELLRDDGPPRGDGRGLVRAAGHRPEHAQRADAAARRQPGSAARRSLRARPRPMPRIAQYRPCVPVKPRK